ncbi:DUF6011 domain-containing protein [Streptomyces sp. BBFR109]|uniref:DUF6011 domain-containing protein n=1 Tax=Streptomyces sp. BBFR109 TaxID=3448172 RepID=UPI003F771F40
MTDLHDEEPPVRCACGRLLRDPESRTRKLGPVCWRKLHGRPRRTPHITPPATSTQPIPGQTELPLDPMQPTLWSL